MYKVNTQATSHLCPGIVRIIMHYLTEQSLCISGFCVVRCHRKCVRLKCQDNEDRSLAWCVSNDLEFENEDYPTSVCLR